MAERILVLDDEPTICEIVSAMLVPYGYQCETGTSGQAALDLLRSGSRYDLIVTNLLMAEMDGLALLARLRVEFPAIPAVVESGVHHPPATLATLRAGSLDYLLKPFSREQLLATIRRALRVHREGLVTRGDKSTLELLVEDHTEELRQTLSALPGSDPEALAQAWAARDENGERDRRVLTAFTIAVAQFMGVPRDEIRRIAYGAYFHDAGQFPPLRDVLMQPEILEPGELAILRRSTHEIYGIMRAVPALTDAAEVAYAYQECHDGSGQPRGLKGEQIPLGARIVRVVHVVLRVISDTRPPATPQQCVDKAYQEIQRQSGKQLAPAVVKAVINIPASIWKD